MSWLPSRTTSDSSLPALADCSIDYGAAISELVAARLLQAA